MKPNIEYIVRHSEGENDARTRLRSLGGSVVTVAMRPPYCDRFLLRPIYSELLLRPARPPRVTNLGALLRLASSIISSPNITAPALFSSVATRYASRMSHALSNCSWVGEYTSLRINA